MAFAIPSMLLKQLYTFGSLENGDGFVKFSVKNRLSDATITSVDRLVLGGHDIPMNRVTLDLGGGELLTPEESREFMLSAKFGGHLLYPYEDGKVIQLFDTEPVEGQICHHLRVILDDEFQQDYYLDVRTYLEVKTVTKDLKSGKITSSTYHDYVRVDGIPVPQRVVSFEADKIICTVKLAEIKSNAGVTSWMFQMPDAQ